MYPYGRLFIVALRGRFAKRLPHGWGHHTMRMRAWPTDLDVYPEVNNGRHLTLMDLGRYDLAFKLGLPKLLRKRRWAFIIGGANVRYRHRLRPFRRLTMHTDLMGADDKWFLFHQWTEQRGRVCSSALIKAGVASKSGLVRPDDVMAALHGGPVKRPALPAWASAWVALDAERPWPPEPSAAAAEMQALSAGELRLSEDTRTRTEDE